MNPIRRILLCLALLVSGLAGVTTVDTATAPPALAGHASVVECDNRLPDGSGQWDCDHWDIKQFPLPKLDVWQPCARLDLMWCIRSSEGADYIDQATPNFQFAASEADPVTDCQPKLGHVRVCVVPQDDPGLRKPNGGYADGWARLYSGPYFNQPNTGHTVGAVVFVTDEFDAHPARDVLYKFIFRHELGHVVGLGHRPENPPVLMSDPPNQAFPNLDQHDRDVLNQLYNNHPHVSQVSIDPEEQAGWGTPGVWGTSWYYAWFTVGVTQDPNRALTLRFDSDIRTPNTYLTYTVPQGSGVYYYYPGVNYPGSKSCGALAATCSRIEQRATVVETGQIDKSWVTVGP